MILAKTAWFAILPPFVLSGEVDLPHAPSSESVFPMRVAVFLPNWLGDLTMATPTLRAMRRAWGQSAQIVGILRPYLNDVLAGTDWIDELWHFDPRSKNSALHSRALVARMREDRFDLAVLLTNSLRTAWIAWRGGARERVGYARYGRGPLLTGKIYPRRENGKIVAEPMVDSYLAISQSLGCGDESRRLELRTTADDENSADRVFETLGVRQDGRLALLNSSGAYGGSKLWPPEYFGELARRIADETDHDVLLMCGPKERELARRIAELSRHPRVFTMADQPMDIGTAKACMGRGRLMISTDSGPRHVAAALGLPVITFFGPMLPIWSDNPTQNAVHLLADLDCVGCRERVCPLKHHRCMRDISVDRVFREAVAMLEPTTPAKKAA